MSADYWCGIDPGKTGALAFINGTEPPAIYDMPYVGKELDIASLVDILAQHPILRADIEYQQSMPQSKSSSMFTLGEGYGALKAILAARGIPFGVPRPLAWKRAIGLPVGADKEASRAKALQLFPNAAPVLKRKMDHGRAEALLIAEHCRRTYANYPEPLK